MMAQPARLTIDLWWAPGSHEQELSQQLSHLLNTGLVVPVPDGTPSRWLQSRERGRSCVPGSCELDEVCIPESGDSAGNAIFWFPVLCPLVRRHVPCRVLTAGQLEREHPAWLFQGPGHWKFPLGELTAFTGTSLKMVGWGKKTMWVFSYIRQWQHQQNTFAAI